MDLWALAVVNEANGQWTVVGRLICLEANALHKAAGGRWADGSQTFRRSAAAHFSTGRVQSGRPLDWRV